MLSVSEKDFSAVVLNSSRPVLVDFFADWCGPCRMLAPTLEQLFAETGGKYDIVKVNVEDNYDLAKRYGVMSIPTMIVFKDGELAEKVVGLRSKKDITEMLNRHI